MVTSLAFSALFLWLALSPRFAIGLYTRLLLTPKKYCGTEEDRSLLQSLNGEEVWFFNRAGNKLRGFFVGDREAKSMLLYSMGNDGDIEKRAETLQLLVNSGLSVFIYEYAGYGKSEGKPSLSGLHRDARDAFDFVCGKYNKNAADIILYGESLGGAISSKLAIEREVGALILKSTFASLSRISRELCPWLYLTGYPSCLYPDLDNCKAVRLAGVPTLIVHGWGDRKIKWRHALQIEKSCPTQTQLIWLRSSRHGHMSQSDMYRFAESVASFANWYHCKQSMDLVNLKLDIMQETGELDSESLLALGEECTNASALLKTQAQILASLVEAVPQPTPEILAAEAAAYASSEA